MNNTKVCRRGLNDIWINEADGRVRMCGWTNFFIGNLTENTIEEIWNGELANEFRKSMLDGSYRYCNHSKCPHCANDELEQLMADYEVPELPTVCSLSYQLQCNYACKFCRTEPYKTCECERDKYLKIEKEVKKMLPHLKTLMSNGAGEFFCSDSIIKLIENEKLNKDINICIETNGSLFNEKNWQRIKKLGEHNLSVAVTVHSFNEDTYRYLSGTMLPVAQVIHNLEFISELRKKNIVNRFEIATVVCERNFREMPEYVKKCLNDFTMDTIRLRFFEPYGVMDVNTEWFYDVRNEYHPYHDEFEKVMSNSIFENEKVWRWQGTTKSLQKENPYVLEKKTLQTLSEFILLKNKKTILQYWLNENNIKKVALYGASNIGKAYRYLFVESGINIDLIFDTYVQSVDEEEFVIRQPQESLVNEYDLIIITTEVYAGQIYETLSRMEYKGIAITITQLVERLKSERGSLN